MKKLHVRKIDVSGYFQKYDNVPKKEQWSVILIPADDTYP